MQGIEIIKDDKVVTSGSGKWKLSDAFKENYLTLDWVHLYLLLGSVIFFMMGSGEGFRTCAYLNILVIAFYFFHNWKSKEINWKPITAVIAVPAIFIFLDFLAQNNFENSVKIYKKIALTQFLLIGWWIVFQNITSERMKFLLNTILSFSIFFILFQFALSAEFLPSVVASWRYGTFNNPHHLAIFTLFSFFTVLGYLLRTYGLKKIALGGLLFLSGWLLLHTSSRTAWIGALAGIILLYPYLANKARFIITFITIGICSLLYKFSSLFRERVYDLVQNVGHEERVEIWSNSWQLLQKNSVKEWLVGHGFETFNPSYKLFIPSGSLPYTHPHNYFLELLYVNGMVGLLVGVMLYVYLLLKTLSLIGNKTDAQLALFGKLLFVSAASIYIHLFLTLPYYSTYNFYFMGTHFLMISYISYRSSQLTRK